MSNCSGLKCHFSVDLYQIIITYINLTCANGGSCVDGVNCYSCNCTAGYTGDHCQTGNFLFLITGQLKVRLFSLCQIIFYLQTSTNVLITLVLTVDRV